MLSDLAKAHYGTVKRMATFWAGDIGCRCNNLRSAQIRSFKKIWLTCGAPNAIVVNVTRDDLKKKDRPMKVVEAVIQSGLPTIEDVRMPEECQIVPKPYRIRLVVFRN